LLGNVEDARRSAPPTADGRRLLQVSSYMNVNIPWLMVLTNTMGWLILVFTASGSYVFLQEMYKMLTPKCKEYSGLRDMGAYVMCHATGICFWTFPFVCMLAAVSTFGVNLYNIRLYYECLLHRIMVNYDNNKFLHSCFAWLLFAYGVLAMSSVFYLSEAPAGTTSIVFAVNRGLIVYAAPLVSCLLAIASQWQLEWHLIPLPKFYETDPDLARKVLSEAVFVPEAHLRVAFEELEELLDEQQQQQQHGKLTSAEYFGLLADALRRTVSHEASTEDVQQEESSSWAAKLLARLDVVKTVEFSRRCAKVRRPELLTLRHQARRGGYWVHRLLHSRHLDDERSASFRFWGRLHVSIAVLAFLMILEVYVAMIRDFLKYQRAA